MKRFLSILMSTVLALASLSAQDLTVTSFRHVGPYPVVRPMTVDSLDIAGKPFDAASVLDGTMPLDALDGAETVEGIPVDGGEAMHIIGFSTQNTIFAKATVKVQGLRDYRLYMDGTKVTGTDVKMEPGTHDFVLKYLNPTPDADKDEDDETPAVTVTRQKGGALTLRSDGRHIFSLDCNTIGIACGGVSISPNGKYIALTSVTTDSEGKGIYSTELTTIDGRFLSRSKEGIQWMPSTDRYWTVEKSVRGRNLVCTDPATGEQTVLARDIPEGWFTIAPTEDYLIFNMNQEGPKEGDVHQIVAPDDRQPGWRDRNYLVKYDLATGVMQQLTFGWHSVYLDDISADGRRILVSTSRERLTKRPTQLKSVYEIDLATMETRCLVSDDGFVSSAKYSPDATRLLLTGASEAFDGIGKDVKEGQIPNGYDVQAFVMDIASGKVTPITKKFRPSVDQAVWSKADGQIYLKVEDKDCKSLYRMNPANGKAVSLGAKEDNVSRFGLAKTGNAMVYAGQSLSNGDRAYLVDLKSDRQTLLRDFSAERLDGVDMGEGLAYEFKSSRGDMINCFYVLPPDFDASKKYPMLVHYYGGCSPTARYCIGSYSPQVYAAQGYVFLVVNPSGAAGFGQEFAARHVNTAGDVVADDIIEATQRFCKDHPYVDADHIGCFSASYGGFMTQLLLSKTDIYATGISHAGISDHTSYWGEGYWGYSYSEISMADSYPWTRKDLYVDRSPLYFADRIHTPLLFLHGSADTNVPIGESIQMFTALKILGEETAFVVVDGENHGIREFNKRRQWLRTIFAWFSKYLQEDDTWWNELYPEKNL